MVVPTRTRKDGTVNQWCVVAFKLVSATPELLAARGQGPGDLKGSPSERQPSLSRAFAVHERKVSHVVLMVLGVDISIF